MVRGVGVQWLRKDGCEAVVKGWRGCSVVIRDGAYFIFSSPTFCSANMPSCGFCDFLKLYDIDSMARGVKVR